MNTAGLRADAPGGGRGGLDAREERRDGVEREPGVEVRAQEEARLEVPQKLRVPRREQETDLRSYRSTIQYGPDFRIAIPATPPLASVLSPQATTLTVLTQVLPIS